MTTQAFRRAVAVLMLGWLACAVAADGDGYTQALELHQRGDNATALARIDTYLGERPRDSRARFLKGLILAAQNRPQEAIDVLTMLSEEFPELPEPHNNLAVLYAGQGRYEDARRELEMAVRAYPGFAIAHQNLGDVYAALAARAYEEALQADANSAVARTRLEQIRALLPQGAVAAATPAPAPSAATPAAAPPAAAPRAGTPTTAPRAGTPATTPPAGTPAAAPRAAAAPPAGTLATAPPLPAGEPLPPFPTPRASPEKTVAVTPATPPPPDTTRTVLGTVDDWARAWAGKDVEKYFSLYAKDFRTPKGEPRGNWEADRRKQIDAPRTITVQVVEPKVTLNDPNHATVVFRQNYRADAYRSSGRKTLQLVRQGERWLIQQETITFR